MAGEEIRIGPFTAGLDTASDPTAIPDSALSEVINFELSDDGSLTNRPPIVALNKAIEGNGTIEVLGFFNDGIAYRMIATNTVSGGGTYFWDGTSWSRITSEVFKAGVQFNDRFWMVKSPEGTTLKGGSGYWSPTTGFVEVPDMPRGEGIITHKSRLWVWSGDSASIGKTFMFYSGFDATSAVVWAASTPSIGVGAGDGQSIRGLLIHNEDIVVFKESSTFRFTYVTDPAQGSVSRVSSTVGLQSRHCLTEFESTVYLLHRNTIYTFVNFNFTPINSRVPLKFSVQQPNLHYAQSLSVWADRLIVTQFERTYVYKIRTRTWCEWRSTLEGLTFIGKFHDDPSARVDQKAAFIVSPLLNNQNRIWYVTDAVLSNVREEMICSFVTKNYDYQSPSKNKRLFWWGADILSRGNWMRFTVKPSTPVDRVTWAEMLNTNWTAVKERTWANPLDDTLYDVVDQLTPDVTNEFTSGRRLVKIPRSIRFRQTKYKVEIRTYGDPQSAPVNVFSLTTAVAMKQTVSKKAS